MSSVKDRCKYNALQVEGEGIDQVEEIRYFGNIINSKGGTESVVPGTNTFLNNMCTNITRKTKLMLLRINALLHATKNWKHEET